MKTLPALFIYIFLYIFSQPILAQNLDNNNIKTQDSHIFQMIILNKKPPYNIVTTSRFLFRPGEKVVFPNTVTFTHCPSDYDCKKEKFDEFTISLLIENKQKQNKVTLWSDQSTNIPLSDDWQFLGEIYVRKNKMYFIPQNKKSEKILMQTVQNRNGQNMLVYIEVLKAIIDTPKY